MPTVRAFLAFSLLAAGSVFAGEDMPADLRAYLEEIKAEGMTEAAASALRMVAAIEAGSTILEIQTDEAGKVSSRGYTSGLCARPGMSEEARAQLRKEMEEMEAKVERELERLRPLADRDGSGFVSSEEGGRFRHLYELGKSVLVVTADGLRDGEQVAERLQMRVEKLHEDLAAYTTVKDFAPLPDLKFSRAAR
ncbi:MAG TPA: hypothetical protein VNW71_14345 [Thermoanaerobaculia bacterium]|nr:hypothetical protein [Thermoanaerobaculia bacterium]